MKKLGEAEIDRFCDNEARGKGLLAKAFAFLGEEMVKRVLMAEEREREGE